jgi:hypothetical protein
MNNALVLLVAGTLPLMALAADPSPEHCFEQARQLPADQQDSFVKACLGETPAPASTVTPEQRARVCESIARNERFQGEQRAAFIKGCTGG